MQRFKKRFKNMNVRRKRISEEFTNSLYLILVKISLWGHGIQRMNQRKSRYS